jgi:hypothetical protein
MLSMRRSCVLIVSLSLLLFFCLGTVSKAQEGEPAKSTVSSTAVEGSWAVGGASKITFTYKVNHKTRHVSFALSSADTWTFNPDGIFSTVDHGIAVDGAWTEKGANVRVFFNIAQYQTLLEKIFALEGYPAIFTSPSVSATGTVKGDTLKATLTIKAKAYFIDYGISGTITAKGHFVATMIEPGEVVSADPEDESLIDGISKGVIKGLTSPEEE